MLMQDFTAQTQQATQDRDEQAESNAKKLQAKADATGDSKDTTTHDADAKYWAVRQPHASRRHLTSSPDSSFELMKLWPLKRLSRSSPATLSQATAESTCQDCCRHLPLHSSVLISPRRHKPASRCFWSHEPRSSIAVFYLLSQRVFPMIPSRK